MKKQVQKVYKKIYEQKLYNSFLGKQKDKLDATILTAADSKYFIALQTLICSIRLNHHKDQRIICVDLGLTKIQKQWLLRQRVIVQTKPSRLLMPRSVEMWQTWNKPQYILQQTFGNIIWIDADCIVLDSLKLIDNLVKEQFVIFACTAAIHSLGMNEAIKTLRNEQSLDKFKEGEYPNAGVLAFNIERDLEILEYWSELVKRAATDKKYREIYHWYDQGALQETLEVFNETDKVICDKRYNDGTRQARDFNELIRNLDLADKQGTRIIHFPCGSKPYNIKEYPKKLNITNYPANRQDLTIYVLGHKNRKKLKENCLQYIHLPDILEDNSLAESRIFYSNLINNCDTEYLGLTTAQWDEKYKFECCSLAKLHRLRLHQSVVYAARKADKYWLQQTEKDHKGMQDILMYLADRLQLLNKLDRETLWSNNFVAHKSVVIGLQSWFWSCWSLVVQEYGNEVHELYKYPREATPRPLSYLSAR